MPDASKDMNKNIKISIILPSLRIGGASRVMLNIARGLAKYDLYLKLVLFNAGKEGLSFESIPNNIRVIDLNEKRSIKILFKLLKYYRQEKPSVVLTARHRVNIIAILAKLMSLRNVRLVIREINPISEVFNSSKRFKKRVRGVLMCWLYPAASAVIANSTDVANDLLNSTRISPKKVKVIYNPVITEESSIEILKPVEHKWFSNNLIPVVLSVGRLSPMKDHLTLIKAFSLIKKNKVVRLLIIGEGVMRSNLEKKVYELGLHDTVEFIGAVQNPLPYMAHSQIVVVSSIFEGFGNVIVESLMTGTSVVSTCCKGGPREILNDGEYGDLVPVGNAEAMAQAIINRLDNPFPPEKLKKRALDFSEKVIIPQYYNVLMNHDPARR